MSGTISAARGLIAPDTIVRGRVGLDSLIVRWTAQKRGQVHLIIETRTEEIAEEVEQKAGARQIQEPK